jgi:hypothetical protein
MSVAGGCRCGAVRYALAIAAFPRAYACHCRDCQTWSGSAFSLQVVVAEGAIVVEGPVVRYDFLNPSGNVSHQRMCGICHTRIFNTNDARPGIAVVRAGTLDDSDVLAVPLHIWAKRKQPWVRLPDDAVVFDEAASVEAIMAIWAR